MQTRLYFNIHKCYSSLLDCWQMVQSENGTILKEAEIILANIACSSVFYSQC